MLINKTTIIVTLCIFCTIAKPNLQKQAKKSELLFGSAFFYRAGWDVKEYEKQFLENFNCLTPEAGTIFREVSPQKDSLDFSVGDMILSFAHKNNIPVRFHHLLWHRHMGPNDYLLPKWLLEGKFSKKELTQYLKWFITTTVSHYTQKYPGTIQWWSVVNEAGSNNRESFEPNLWFDSLGTDIIDSAFFWVDALAPKAKLFYNDYYYHGAAYGGQRMQHKIDFTYEVVKKLLSKKIPIDAVGFQSHLSLQGYPGKEAIAKDFKRFTDLGLEVYVTELDVAITGDKTKEKLQKQAQIFKDILEIVLENPQVKTLTLWGFNDAQTWQGAKKAPVIMDSAYTHKPAWDSLYQTLK